MKQNNLSISRTFLFTAVVLNRSGAMTEPKEGELLLLPLDPAQSTLKWPKISLASTLNHQVFITAEISYR